MDWKTIDLVGGRWLTFFWNKWPATLQSRGCRVVFGVFGNLAGRLARPPCIWVAAILFGFPTMCLGFPPWNFNLNQYNSISITKSKSELQPQIALQQEWGGAQWAMIPKLRIFKFLVFISQELHPKGKSPAFFAHKRNMVFADGLEIKFYPNLMF